MLPLTVCVIVSVPCVCFQIGTAHILHKPIEKGLESLEIARIHLML